MLQVDKDSSKERFEMEYLHQVSYLRDTYVVDKHHVWLVFCIAYIFLCSPCTYSDSLLKKQNTKYRPGGNSHQADTSRVRTTNGDNIAISDDGTSIW